MADEHNPVAWAVVNPSGGTRFLGVTKEAAQQEATASERVAPVYWPVFTDAEREAVQTAVGWIESPGMEDDAMPEDYLPITNTLRGLLERTAPNRS